MAVIIWVPEGRNGLTTDAVSGKEKGHYNGISGVGLAWCGGCTHKGLYL